MRTVVFAVLLAASGTDGSAAPDDGRLTVRQHGLMMALTARTSDQLAAFYSARGFPPEAVERISRTCFITISLRNDSSKVLWLEPGTWRMVDPQGRAVSRIARPEWDRLWNEIRLPPSYRATFGWTLLPESRDLQPGEAVGGNITLVSGAGEFTLTAYFATSQDRHGEILSVPVPPLRCAPARPAAS